MKRQGLYRDMARSWAEQARRQDSGIVVLANKICMCCVSNPKHCLLRETEVYRLELLLPENWPTYHEPRVRLKRGNCCWQRTDWLLWALCETGELPYAPQVICLVLFLCDCLCQSVSVCSYVCLPLSISLCLFLFVSLCLLASVFVCLCLSVCLCLLISVCGIVVLICVCGIATILEY